ncbi:Zn-ribbon domain-containing OB-fold protein [Nocardia sp. KC 131]|uniref:Zn-ribbon domain-containing OB-fold protein n=1 Tax=Nocardia arseniciresistens TaxID=3392119 RepID=UPI00398EE23E
MSEHPYASSDNPVSAESALMVRRCGRCNRLFSPLTAECSWCGACDLEWAPSSGLGSIVSWRLVHRSLNRPHAQVSPLTIAIVELDEGPWMYTTIEGDLPPIADQPIRVRFESRLRMDRFPVFAICPATPDADDDVCPAPQRGSASNHMRSTRRPGVEHCCDASWVRTSLRQCELMEDAKSLDAAAKSLISFAIRWAPFGGATAGELLVTFGVTRRQFLQMVEEALHPRRADSLEVRGLKRHLRDSLTQTWRLNSTAFSAGDAIG